jgi:hypothetical protein
MDRDRAVEGRRGSSTRAECMERGPCAQRVPVVTATNDLHRPARWSDLEPRYASMGYTVAQTAYAAMVSLDALALFS